MNIQLFTALAALLVFYGGSAVGAQDLPSSSAPCLSSHDVTRTMTPPGLYPNIQSCLKQDKMEEASVLFFMATAYAAYDFNRVENEGKTDILKQGGENFKASLSEETNAAFAALLRKQMALPQTAYPICEAILNLGPPDYVPTYLLDPDRAAGTPGYKTDFDIKAAWLNAIKATTRCPVEGLQLKSDFKP